jgi:hypothetical protein
MEKIGELQKEVNQQNRILVEVGLQMRGSILIFCRMILRLNSQ